MSHDQPGALPDSHDDAAQALPAAEAAETVTETVAGPVGDAAAPADLPNSEPPAEAASPQDVAPLNDAAVASAAAPTDDTAPLSDTVQRRRSLLTETAASPAQAPAAPSPDEWSTITPAWKDRSEPTDDESSLLAGASVLGRPASRAAAHWSGVLVALSAVPCAWFLTHDAAQRLTGADATVWPSGVDVVGLVELLIGLLLFAAAVLVARRSSLGSWVVGVLTTLVGLPFVIVPSLVHDHVGPTFERLAAHSRFGADLSHYLMSDGLTGRFLLLGIFMMALGAVSHGARREGRRERGIIEAGKRR